MFMCFLLLLILVESWRGRRVKGPRQVRSNKFKANVNKHIAKIEQELNKLKHTIKQGQQGFYFFFMLIPLPGGDALSIRKKLRKRKRVYGYGGNGGHEAPSKCPLECGDFTKE